MIFSVSRDVQLYLLKSIFHPRCMVLVRIVKIRITVKDRICVKRSGLGSGLGLVLVGLDVVQGLKIAPVVYICQTLDLYLDLDNITYGAGCYHSDEWLRSTEERRADT